jgi:cell division protein ZapA
MAAKNDIDITIGGKTFTLSGVESEAYLREVASYLNEKLKNFSDDAAYWKLPNDMRNVMLQLNLADDYFKERSRVQELESQVQELEDHRDRALQDLDEMQGTAQEAAARALYTLNMPVMRRFTSTLLTLCSVISKDTPSSVISISRA